MYRDTDMYEHMNSLVIKQSIKSHYVNLRM